MSLYENAKDAVQVLFGLKKATGPNPISQQPQRIGSPPSPDEDLALLSSTYEFFRGYTHLEPDRQSVYNDMDELFSYVLASAAMDAYIEDSLQEDLRSGQIVMVKSPNPRVQAAIEKLFERVELEERLVGDLWNLGKYGDYFNLLLYEKDKGVFDMRPLEPRICHRHEDHNRQLRGFTIGDDSEAAAAVDSEPRYKPWDMVHFRLRRYRPLDPYGSPFLINCRLIYKILKLCEEQMTIYRLNMHPDRLIFKVFTGSMNPEERYRTIKKWRKAMEKIVSINHVSGKMISERAPWALDQNIYWPIGQNEDKSGVEKFPGSANAGDLFDIHYLRDLFFAGTRVPKGYMGFEDSQGYRCADTLSQQSVKFARGVKRLRKPLLQGYVRVGRIHLALLGIDASQPQNGFELSMAPINYLEEAQKGEFFAKRFETVNFMMDMGAKMAENLGINLKTWATFVMEEFAGFDEPTIAKLLSPELKQSKVDMMFAPVGRMITFERLPPEKQSALREACAGNDVLMSAIQELVRCESLIPSGTVVRSTEGNGGRLILPGSDVTNTDRVRYMETAAQSDAATRKAADGAKGRLLKEREELRKIAREAQERSRLAAEVREEVGSLQ